MSTSWMKNQGGFSKELSSGAEEGTKVKGTKIVIGRITIVVQWSEFKGKTGLDIRKYFVSKDTGKLVPSRKGIWIPEDAVEEVAKAVQIAAEVRRSL